MTTEIQQDTVSHLEESGADISIVQADVAQTEQMTGMFGQTLASLPDLKGVVHAAGVTAFQSLEAIKLDDLNSVLQPKVTGTWTLHQLTRNMDLDFFVNFSSIASVWGSGGQAHYAAANQFLDSLSHYRREKGLPALSVNWGPWAEGGMVTAEAQNLLTKMGIQLLPPEKVMKALEYLIGTDSCQMTVAHVDWNAFKDVYEIRGKRVLLEYLGKKMSEDNDEPDTETQSSVLQQFTELAEQERQPALVLYLQEQIGSILGLESPDPDQGFFDMGMDSLMAVEVKNSLEKYFRISLPSTVVFDYPTIKDLARYIAEKLFGGEAQAPGQPPSKDAQTEEKVSIQQLSENEVEDSIEKELAELENLLAK